MSNSTPFTVEEQNGQFLNIDNCRSYKTEANLIKAINNAGFNRELDRFIVVCNRKGRFTAIFSVQSPRVREGGYIGVYADHGFMMQ